MRFIDGAMPLIARGWSVFPLSPGSKLPAISARKGGKGVLDATRDEEQVKEWARRWPSANVGLACGRASGFTVIDIDPKSGGMDSVRAFKETKRLLPATITVRTPSGGWHLYYQYEPLLLNSKGKLGPGIDVRTSGGYVVAPPSRLDNGKVYSWHTPPEDGDGGAVPRMPRWAFEKLKPKEDAIFSSGVAIKNAGKALDGLQSFVCRAAPGERNSALYWAACRAAEGGFADDATRHMLAAAAGRVGISQKEAFKSIGSAFKARKRFA